MPTYRHISKDSRIYYALLQRTNNPLEYSLNGNSWALRAGQVPQDRVVRVPIHKSIRCGLHMLILNISNALSTKPKAKKPQTLNALNLESSTNLQPQTLNPKSSHLHAACLRARGLLELREARQTSPKTLLRLRQDEVGLNYSQCRRTEAPHFFS